MSQFKTPGEYAIAALPFLHPQCITPHYLHPQVVNECIEVFTARDHSDVLKEIGDALFYIILPAYALVAPGAKPGCRDAALVPCHPDDWLKREHDTEFVSVENSKLQVLENAESFGSHWAKTIREPDTKEKRIKHMAEHAEEILRYLRDIANAHGASLADVAALNFAKLSDRKTRGVLLGDGSNR